MDLDPHTFHLILEKITQQLACPQCSAHMDMEYNAMRLCGDNFMVFQMQCPHCEAHIVLHATVAGVAPIELLSLAQKEEQKAGRNFSTSIHMETEEIQILRDSLKNADGSFLQLFTPEPKKG